MWVRILRMGFGCWGIPSRLSAPVALTLALSRRAGEGMCPWSMEVLVGVSGMWFDCCLGGRVLRLWIITRRRIGDCVMFRRAVHPGEVLKEELAEFGVTPTEFARQIDVPANRVSQIIAGKRSVTGDSALRFGHWFGVDPQFWLNLQSQYDLVIAEGKVGDEVRGLSTAAVMRG